MDVLLFALWFFLPAGAANAVPVPAAKLPVLRRWNAPMDFGRTLHGERILGSHKTWRGLICGMIASTIVLWLQQLILAHVSWTHSLAGPVDYASLPTLVMGPLFGFGVLAGDAIKSFFKRRHGVVPGRSWFPFDQTDFIIGGVLATVPFVVLDWTEYLAILFVWVAAQMLAKWLGYLAGLNEQPI